MRALTFSLRRKCLTCIIELQFKVRRCVQKWGCLLRSRWGCQSSLRKAFEVSFAIITTRVRADSSNLTWYPFTMTQLWDQNWSDIHKANSRKGFRVNILQSITKVRYKNEIWTVFFFSFVDLLLNLHFRQSETVILALPSNKFHSQEVRVNPEKGWMPCCPVHSPYAAKV